MHTRLAEQVNLPQNPGVGPHQSFLGLLIRQLQSILARFSDALNNSKIRGSVSLATSPATYTEITHQLIDDDTHLDLMPTNLMGSAEIGAGNIYFTYPADQTIRINHTVSTQARTFNYLLLALVLTFVGVRSDAQQIQDDGTAIEVRPALNFTGNITCANDADSTNCSATGAASGNDWAVIDNAVAEVGGDTLAVTDSASINFTTTNDPDNLTAIALCGGIVSCPGGSAITTSMSTDRLLGRRTAGAGVVEEIDPSTDFVLTAGAPITLDINPSGNVMLASDWATIFGYPFVDWAFLATQIDSDANGLPEFYCVGNTCYFDADEDGSPEFALTPLSAAIAFDPDSDGLQDFVIGPPGTGMGSVRTQLRDAEGLGVGRPDTDSYAIAASSCIGRENSNDRLFEDRNCNFGTVITPEVGENFFADLQKRLTSTATTIAVAGAGVEVVNIQITLNWIGAYWIEYQLLTQSALATCGQSFGVNYTGAFTSLYCGRSFVSTGVTCPAVPACLIIPCPAIPACGATGVVDDVAATNAGQHAEGYAANAASTVTPNLGPSAGVATVDSTALETIRCNLLTTGAGDLELWMTSETGSTVRVMANSMVRATPFP